MNAKHVLSAVVLLALVCPCDGQHAPPVLPAHGPAPLLFVRFVGGANTQVSLYQGDPAGRSFPTPAVAGLRPGYIYRVRLSGLPGYERAEFFPSLEVRGTLHLPPTMKASDYPAPISFTIEDLDRALAGTMVTKVIYLEHPEKAYPAKSERDFPWEREVRDCSDLVKEAQEYGRPMVIVRLGGRSFSGLDLARQNVPGTILMPGDPTLGPPVAPPCVPYVCWNPYDPHGGKPPEEECIPDGGDHGLKAGFDGQGKLRNVEPTDTVAEYRDVLGGRHITPSNRICICVPRYAVLKLAIPIAGLGTSTGPEGFASAQEFATAVKRLPSLEAQQSQELVQSKGRLRASMNVATQGPDRLVQLCVLRAIDIELGPERVVGTEQIHGLTKAQQTLLAKKMEFSYLISCQNGTRSLEQQPEGPIVVGKIVGTEEIMRSQATREITLGCKDTPEPPCGPLVLHKWADRQAGQIGDVVTFYLKFTNVGGQPISDVAVADSLSGRLEYVVGSAKSDRDTVFTMQQNEAGSVLLRWEVGGKVMPGQSGIVSFQARIR